MGCRSTEVYALCSCWLVLRNRNGLLVSFHECNFLSSVPGLQVLYGGRLLRIKVLLLLFLWNIDFNILISKTVLPKLCIVDLFSRQFGNLETDF